MKLVKTPTFPALLVFLLLSGFLMSCNKDECEDVVCAPCESSRFVAMYQDTSGNCDSIFGANARVYGFKGNNTNDTIYSYSFLDDCQVKFLVQDTATYHIVSGTQRDTLEILDYTFQSPGVEEVKCCICYPVDSLFLRVNNELQVVKFPAGKFQNNAVTFQID